MTESINFFWIAVEPATHFLLRKIFFFLVWSSLLFDYSIFYSFYGQTSVGGCVNKESEIR